VIQTHLTFFKFVPGATAAVFTSNILTGSPLVINSVMSSGYPDDPDNPAPNRLDIYPQIIQWDKPTTAGHQLEIDDGSGNVLFRAVAPANGEGGYFKLAKGIRWEELWRVSVLQSGQVRIYYKT